MTASATTSSSTVSSKQQCFAFEVSPEHSLRNERLELVLGMPINQVINGIQNVSREVKNVELIYCNKEPFVRDITLTLLNDGIRLHVDAHTQLLKMIELFDFSNITLRYGNTTFSSPSEKADVAKVEKCFGATVPGVYDEKQQKYFLHWRGVSFCFPAKDSSAAVQTSYAHGLASLRFANSTLPQLERMTIFCGVSPAKMRVPEIPQCVYCGCPQLIVAETINENGRITGMHFKFSIEDVGKGRRDVLELVQLERDVFFNDTQEEVMTKLGAPANIYYKSDDKMLIQRRGVGTQKFSNEREEDRPDFFFNYFSLGLDLLFNIHTRRLIKFVLHTNVPGHFDFGVYNRAEFRLSAQTKSGGQPVHIGTESRLDEFRALFAPSPPAEGHSSLDAADEAISGGPVVLNKCSSEGENPFGATFCYGTDQLIVEVLDNGHIASAVIFDERLGP